ELGQHQVEHADVGLLVAKSGEAELAAPDDEGVEAGRGEVAGHAVGDDAVVLDDEDFGHVLTIDPCPCRASCRNGNDLVNEGDGFRGGEEDGRAVRPTPVSEPSMSFDEL